MVTSIISQRLKQLLLLFMIKQEHNQNAIIFSTKFARYGKIMANGKHKIELILPLAERLGYFQITLFIGLSKPIFRNLYLISLLYFPLYVVIFILTDLFWITLSILSLFFSFFYQCLFRKSFITDKYETVSGYISLILALYGLIQLILLFF